jgi:hypothetical protein
LASKKHMAKVGAVLFAAGLPLGLFAGTAVADSSLDNSSSADAYVDQWTGVSTVQDAHANTGDNWADSGVWGENWTEQDADASAWDGNISAEDADDAIAGNTGGTTDQTSGSSNDGTSSATISTGPASATNTAGTTIGQDNSGGADSTQGVTQADIDIDGDGYIDNSSYASLNVSQGADASTSQTAWANSGGNSASSGVWGYNGTGQFADASANGGNIDGSDADGATAGNTGGSATQGSTSANTGTSSASITTGAATSSNSSTTSVTQTNSGGASSNQTVGQTDVDLG